MKQKEYSRFEEQLLEEYSRFEEQLLEELRELNKTLHELAAGVKQVGSVRGEPL